MITALALCLLSGSGSTKALQSVGPHTLSYDRCEQLIRVSRQGKVSFWAHAHNDSYLAAFVRETGQLVVSSGNHVTAYDGHGDDDWARTLQYDFPGFLCASSFVAYDQGRPVGAPKTYRSLREWRSALERQVRMECVRARDGSIAWSRPQSLTGTPLAGWGANLLCAAFPLKEAYAGKIRHWYAQEVEGSSGKVLRRWVFDNPSLGGVDTFEGVGSAKRIEVFGGGRARPVSLPASQVTEPTFDRVRFEFASDGSSKLLPWKSCEPRPVKSLRGRAVSRSAPLARVNK